MQLDQQQVSFVQIFSNRIDAVQCESDSQQIPPSFFKLRVECLNGSVLLEVRIDGTWEKKNIFPNFTFRWQGLGNTRSNEGTTCTFVTTSRSPDSIKPTSCVLSMLRFLYFLSMLVLFVFFLSFSVPLESVLSRTSFHHAWNRKSDLPEMKPEVRTTQKAWKWLRFCRVGLKWRALDEFSSGTHPAC